MRNQKSEKRKLFVKRYSVVSVVGTLRAASVFDTSLLRAETKHPCGDYISHAKSAESTEF